MIRFLLGPWLALWAPLALWFGNKPDQSRNSQNTSTQTTINDSRSVTDLSSNAGTILGSGASQYQNFEDYSDRSQVTVGVSTDAGAVKHAFDFADTLGGAALSHSDNVSQAAIDVARRVNADSLGFARQVNSDSLGFGADALARIAQSARDALGFGDTAQERAYAFADNVTSGALQATAQALSYVDRAYTDARGEGVSARNATLGALAIAGAVAVLGVFAVMSRKG